MWPMKDMFYAKPEPIWILNHDKDDEEDESSSTIEPAKEEYSASSSSNEWEREQNSTHGNSSYYPYYDPYSSYPYRPDPHYIPQHDHHDVEKETEVVMKVPICCSECEDSIKGSLNQMKGVKNVKCYIHNEKVSVITTTAAPADILMACRKLFRRSRMWSDDD